MRGLTFDLAASALFLALLLLPAARMPFVDAAHYERVFAERENRPPARVDLKPPTAAGLRENIREIESWFADRYGFRTELIALASRLSLAAGVSPREDLVLLGEDGWLFLGNAQNRVIDKTTGRLLFTEAQLDAYAAGLEEQRRWLADRGIGFMVFVAPEKHTIYPDLLPAWARNHTAKTMAGQLAERLRGGEVVFADLTETVREARERTDRPLYYRNDTHWNGLGAFAGYRGIMEVVERHFPEARTLEEPKFQERTRPGGDLARMLGVSNGLDAVYTPVFGPELGPIALGGNCSSEERQKGAKEARELKGKQGAEERGGAGKKARGQQRQRGGSSAARERSSDGRYLVVVPNECLPGQAAIVTGSGLARAPRLLLLGDSFATGLSPYLNQSFGTVVYTHYVNAKTVRRLQQYVNRYKPDLVVLEMVERALTPVEERRSDRPEDRRQ